MKIKIVKLSLSLIAASLGAQAAEYDYYWDPAIKAEDEGPSAAGGDGTWGSARTWWSVSNNDYIAGSSLGTQLNTNNLYFNGSSNIIKDGVTAFLGGASGTDTVYHLKFASGTTTSFTASSNTGTHGLNLGNSTSYFDVASGAILNLGGSGSNRLTITAAKNLTGAATGIANAGLIFQGGGIVNLDNAILTTAHGNGKSVIQGGTTLNFRTGSAIYAASGSSSNPLDGALLRVALDNGTLNVDGGNLYVGYHANGNANPGRGFGIVLGTSLASSGDSATLNINSGTVTALGDARTVGAIYAGISFAGTNGSQTGGTVNLNGGTLTTTNIRAMTSLAKATLNLDGGTLVVSTQTMSTDTLTTDAHLQARLNDFITGFHASSATNGVFIGPRGITIETSQIDSTRTNGVATINATMRGSGDLIKTGANTLLLSGWQNFTGNVIIKGGSLAVGNVAGNDNSSSIGAVKKILIENGAVFDTTRRDSAYAYKAGNATNQQLVENQGSGKIVGDFNVNYGLMKPNGIFVVDGSLTSTADSTFKFDNLGTDIIKASGMLSLNAGITIDLSDATLSAGNFNLFISDTSGGITGSLAASNFTGYDSSLWSITDFNNTGMAFSITVAAIPEPSTYALLISLAAMTLMIHRRRQKNK